MNIKNTMSQDFNYEYFKYVVIFHTDNFSLDYSPIVRINKGEKPYQNMSTMHLLDKDLDSILPAVEFVLQLPKHAIDLYNLPEDVIDKAVDSPHDIYIIPDIFACG